MAHRFVTKIALFVGILMLLSAAIVAFNTILPEAAYADSNTALTIGGTTTGSTTTGSNLKGWHKENGKWYYYLDSGEMIKDQYSWIGGKPYLFSYSGALVTKPGWHSLNNNFQIDAKNWYYVKNSNGELHTGWKKSGGKWYYLHGEYCRMLTGQTYRIDGKLYVFLQSGALAASPGWKGIEWRNGSVTWYYVKNSNGEAYTGWKKSGGKWYYLDDDYGQMIAQKSHRVNDRIYVFSESGALATSPGWKKGTNDSDRSKTEWYYVKNNNGEALTGWQKSGGKWYYLATYDGKMVSNRSETVNGKAYYLSSSGALITKTGWHKLTNLWYETSWYYVKNSNGELQQGWMKYGGKWYYFGHNGEMYQNGSYRLDRFSDKTYTFDANGAWVG